MGRSFGGVDCDLLRVECGRYFLVIRNDASDSGGFMKPGLSLQGEMGISWPNLEALIHLVGA